MEPKLLRLFGSSAKSGPIPQTNRVAPRALRRSFPNLASHERRKEPQELIPQQNFISRTAKDKSGASQRSPPADPNRLEDQSRSIGAEWSGLVLYPEKLRETIRGFVYMNYSEFRIRVYRFMLLLVSSNELRYWDVIYKAYT